MLNDQPIINNKYINIVLSKKKVESDIFLTKPTYYMFDY